MEKFKILLPQKKEKKTAIWGFNIKAKDLIMIIKKKTINLLFKLTIPHPSLQFLQCPYCNNTQKFKIK